MNGLPTMTWSNLAQNIGTSGGATDLSTRGTLIPQYTGGACSTNYCHGGVLNGGTGTSPSWTGTTYLTAYAKNASNCGQCHGAPPTSGATLGFAHTNITVANSCQPCHPHDGNGASHINGILDASGGDTCVTCHSSLSVRHATHSDPGTFLTGKALSTNDYGNASWWYQVAYDASGAPKYACGYCHPSDSGTYHMKLGVNVSLSPADPNTAGTVKALNTAGASYAGSGGACSGVYCHSNGYATNLVYATTPNWTAGTFANADKCANCHSNSPNSAIAGSAAHASHVVSIHYKDIYSGTTGKMAQGGAAGAHGNANSTTINCNICHNATVTMSRNKLNSVCVTCHTGDASDATNVMSIAAGSTTHINGTPDVGFATLAATFRSKAQVRDSITSVAEINNSWTRNATSYKTGATPYDTARRNPSYSSGTCSTVDCHNGRQVTWTQSNISCTACHMGTTQ
jgi:predicted CxxxxCH...CXXCH cytochrome family protein